MINFEENFPNSQKVFEKKSIEVAPNDARLTLQVPFREVQLSGGHPPVKLYDTSGPGSDDVRRGIWNRVRDPRQDPRDEQERSTLTYPVHHFAVGPRQADHPKRHTVPPHGRPG